MSVSITQNLSARDRMLAVFRGENVDRFPVWLKMANKTWQSPQPEPYRSMPAADLLTAGGCDLILGNGVPLQKHAPHIRSETSTEADRRITVVHTPDGELVGEVTHDPFTNSWHPTRFMISSAEHIARARWLFTDTTYSCERADAERSKARQIESELLGAVTMTGLSPSPWMDLVEHLAGPQDAVYLEMDEPEALRELIALMHADNLRRLKCLLDHCAADTIWMIENTSTTLISPRQFCEHCMPCLRDYGNLILERHRIPVHHMCGTLNELLEMIDELPAMANEAYTTRPLGNVSLAEGRTRMPSKTLVGGTNATLWLEPVETIVQTVAEDLAQCPDRRRIFLTSAGVLPAPVPFGKAQAVVAGLREL